MTLNLAQLRALVAVVDEGGFGTAAGTLGISQSAVSHAVAALERALGHQVLVRDGAGPRLTAFGGRILDHARAALAATAAIGDLAAQQDGQPVGTIRLAAPPTVCQGLLPDLLAGWRLSLPRVRLRVFEGEDDEVADWLRDGTVEAAVLVDPGPHRGAVVGRDSFHALLRRDHPLAGEPVIDVRDLADDPFLLSAGGCERPVREIHRLARAAFEPVHRVRELGTLLAMVRAGVGVSIVPGLATAMLDRRLVLVPLRQRVGRELVLTGPPDRPWHPAVTALVGTAGPRP